MNFFAGEAQYYRGMLFLPQLNVNPICVCITAASCIFYLYIQRRFGRVGIQYGSFNRVVTFAETLILCIHRKTPAMQAKDLRK